MIPSNIIKVDGYIPLDSEEVIKKGDWWVNLKFRSGLSMETRNAVGATLTEFRSRFGRRIALPSRWVYRPTGDKPGRISTIHSMPVPLP